MVHMAKRFTHSVSNSGLADFFVVVSTARLLCDCPVCGLPMVAYGPLQWLHVVWPTLVLLILACTAVVLRNAAQVIQDPLGITQVCM